MASAIMIEAPSVELKAMIHSSKRALLLTLLVTACAAPAGPKPEIPTLPEPIGSSANPEMAPTQWKERLQVLYLYVDCRGDYRTLGASMQAFLDQVRAAGATPSGAPFGLFYDDPGTTPVNELRSRLCMPVAEVPSSGNLSYDVLPPAMVAYTTVKGPYPQLPRVYPTLLGYLRAKSWVPSGPIREIYLTSPSTASSFDQLLAEVQVPWKPSK